MNTYRLSAREEKVEALAADYERAGFDVIRYPEPDALPFDLENYRPELVAKKDGSGVIITVKTRGARFSIERYQAVAQEVAHHPGWRFLLATVDDVEASFVPTTLLDLPGWDQIAEKLKTVDDLVENGRLEPALLYLGSVFEAALRRRAIARSIPVERLPTNIMLNHLYSQGEVSVIEINCMHEFLDKRNRLSHGMQVVLEPGFVESLVTTVRDLIGAWRDEELSGQATQATA